MYLHQNEGIREGGAKEGTQKHADRDWGMWMMMMMMELNDDLARSLARLPMMYLHRKGGIRGGGGPNGEAHKSMQTGTGECG